MRRLLAIRYVQLRSFAYDKHRRVDDRPYGGGPGMVLKPEPLVAAIQQVRRSNSRVICLSAQGPLLTAAKCRSLAAESHLILVCGHYEGVDERVLQKYVDEEVSIGNYVVTNGGVAALVLVDAIARFIPGVLGHAQAAEQDSFEQDLLDCPHYTRPEIFQGEPVPAVLLSGDHQKIAAWRRERAHEKTRHIRPDLYELYENNRLN